MDAAEIGSQDGLLVEERPLAAFLYALMRDGDVAPARLERLLDDLEQLPPACGRLRGQARAIG
jgi:hypothetical protein